MVTTAILLLAFTCFRRRLSRDGSQCQETLDRAQEPKQQQLIREDIPILVRYALSYVANKTTVNNLNSDFTTRTKEREMLTSMREVPHHLIPPPSPQRLAPPKFRCIHSEQHLGGTLLPERAHDLARIRVLCVARVLGVERCRGDVLALQKRAEGGSEEEREGEGEVAFSDEQDFVGGEKGMMDWFFCCGRGRAFALPFVFTLSTLSLELAAS